MLQENVRMSNTPWSLIAISGQNGSVIMLSISQLTGMFEEWRFSWLNAFFSTDLEKNMSMVVKIQYG